MDRGELSYLINNIDKNSKVDIVFNAEEIEAFSPSLRAWQECPYHPCFLTFVPEILANVVN